jgi:hypothetical protein
LDKFLQLNLYNIEKRGEYIEYSASSNHKVEIEVGC